MTANTITAKPPVRVKGNGPTTICADQVPVELEVVGTLGTEAHWDWYNGTTHTDNDGKSAISAYPTQTTTYNVKGVGTFGGSQAATVTITIKSLPTAPVGKATPSSLCANGGQVTLSVSSENAGTGGSWKWYENKSTPVTVNPFTPPSSSKTYYVRSEGGCGDGPWSGPVKVTVNQPATTPSGSATPSTVCYGDGQKVTLSVTSGTPCISGT